MATKQQEQFIEDISKMSVLELAELVKALEEKFGVSAAVPMAAAPAAGAAAGAAPADAKTEFKVELTEAGPDKIKVIKGVRTVTTLGLTEAKKLVEEGGVIAEAASKADAQKIKEAVEAAGGTVKIS